MRPREAHPSSRLDHLLVRDRRENAIRRNPLYGLLLLACILNGCGHRQVAVPVLAPIGNLPYLHLQPGWRLSIVSPVLTTTVAPSDLRLSVVDSAESSGNATLTLEMKAPDDFGYVRAFVSLRGTGGRLGNSVRFRPDSAHLHKGGDVERIALPEALKTMLPRQSGPARVLFLTRAAAVDHDMAILQAKTQAQLAQLTEAVLASPLESCRVSSDASCLWVPRGVAVRVERPSNAKPGAKGVEWVPVL